MQSTGLLTACYILIVFAILALDIFFIVRMLPFRPRKRSIRKEDIEKHIKEVRESYKKEAIEKHKKRMRKFLDACEKDPSPKLFSRFGSLTWDLNYVESYLVESNQEETIEKKSNRSAMTAR